jgi:hypothetical protein
MNLPFFNELEDAKTILLAGAGGGLDVFCGLPPFSWLTGTAHQVRRRFHAQRFHQERPFVRCLVNVFEVSLPAP